jgi:hypothetical protein
MSDSINRLNEPLEVELLVKEDARRDRVTVATQEAFRTSITPPAPIPFDEIDELVEELRSFNFEERVAAL